MNQDSNRVATLSARPRHTRHGDRCFLPDLAGLTVLRCEETDRVTLTTPRTERARSI